MLAAFKGSQLDTLNLDGTSQWHSII